MITLPTVCLLLSFATLAYTMAKASQRKPIRVKVRAKHRNSR